MADNSKKSEILEKEGFIYHFQRMVYINDEKRKIFSVQAIHDNPIDYLIEKINEISIPDEWQFYFTKMPSHKMKCYILDEIEKSDG